MKGYWVVGGLWAVVMILIVAIAFRVGASIGESRYSESLIAMKYVDGKYGPGHYGVEVRGKKQGARVEVYARILIDPSGSYYHNCGLIGSAPTWEEARRDFGDVQWDGKGVSIGSYRIERGEYENHR